MFKVRIAFSGYTKLDENIIVGAEFGFHMMHRKSECLEKLNGIDIL